MPLPPEWLLMEYAEEGPNQLVDIARSPSGISTLHQATGGDPSQTARWQANIAYGGDQEVIVALRSRTGDLWGALGLYRELGRPTFDGTELAFLRGVSQTLAAGVRRSLLVGEATDPEGPEAPGMIVLDADFDLGSASPGVDDWLELLARPSRAAAGFRRRSSRSPPGPLDAGRTSPGKWPSPGC